MSLGEDRSPTASLATLRRVAGDRISARAPQPVREAAFLLTPAVSVVHQSALWVPSQRGKSDARFRSVDSLAGATLIFETPFVSGAWGEACSRDRQGNKNDESESCVDIS